MKNASIRYLFALGMMGGLGSWALASDQDSAEAPHAWTLSEDAVLPATIERESAGEVVFGPCEVCQTRETKFQRFLRHKSENNRVLPSTTRPFRHDGWIYEPVVSDPRSLPRIRTLPGAALGQQELLPVIPSRRSGYLMLREW